MYSVFKQIVINCVYHKQQNHLFKWYSTFEIKLHNINKWYIYNHLYIQHKLFAFYKKRTNV